MKRYIIYLTASIITFVIGSLLAFNYFTSESNQETKFEMTQISGKWQLVPVKEFSPKKESPVIHELNYQLKQIEFKKPFCNDKKILPMWNLLKDDFIDEGELMFREPNCANMFEILDFDLNSDGKKEIILRARSPDLCGATGNCGFWIFEKKGKKYRKILSSSDYVDVTKMGEQIQKSKTKSYLDIVTKGQFGASDTRHSTYKFNGRKYVESTCLYDAYIGGAPDNPKWEFITCKKFYKRLENE